MTLAVTLREAADDLARGVDRVITELEAIGHRGANNMVRFARARVAGMRAAPAYPYSIGYDYRASTRLLTWEVGPDKARRQGALGNLIEFGSVNNSPRPHIGPALNAEEEAWVRHSAAAIDRLWGG